MIEDKDYYNDLPAAYPEKMNENRAARLRTSAAEDLYNRCFDLDGNPKNVEGQKLYDKHLIGTWWTKEQRWDNNDEENRTIDFLFQIINTKLKEATIMVDQLNYVIEKIRERSKEKEK
jgi:thymidylate synthase